MIGMIRSEWMKLRRSVVWLLAAVSPLFVAVIGIVDLEKGVQFPWVEVLSIASALHAMLFLPLLVGIFAALVCRYEHVGGGWKQMLSLPVSRTGVYAVKLGMVMLLVGVTQLLLLLFILLLGFMKGFSGDIPWSILLGSMLGGWVACLPLAALQLFVSIAFQSFAAPLAVNVVLTLPNILIVNSSQYGPYYPWAQPMLAMLPRDDYGFGAFNMSMETLFIVIVGGFCVFGLVGWTYFQRKAV
ncbi:ABC transporter permease [Paenibacillus sp. MCAF20]